MRSTTALLAVLSSSAILFSTVVSTSINSVEVNRENDRDPILPIEPMVIKIQETGNQVTITPARIEYRGCYKFCVGTVSGNPSYENSKVWNPFNQSTNQVYYFRYFDVDMTDCKWPRMAERHGLSVPELFFDSLSAPSSNSYRGETDDGYAVYDNNYRNQVSENDMEKFVLSYPARIQRDKFTFLIYHPQIRPGRWSVRWTGFMNTCQSNATLPIEEHYEPDAFDPKDFINFQKWEEKDEL